MAPDVDEFEPAAADPEDEVGSRFRRGLTIMLRQLVTPEIVAEHEEQPVGNHSPALATVLAVMRQAPTAGKLAVLFSPDTGIWQILTLSADRSVPHEVDEAARFSTEGEALHEVFIRRLAELGVRTLPIGSDR